MEPVYGVGRVVGVGKLNDSLCLSPCRSSRTTNYPARDRKHPSRTKKSACSIAGAALESPSHNPRAVDEPEREAILAIGTRTQARKRPLKTPQFE
jgi:hypothetical protein